MNKVYCIINSNPEGFNLIGIYDSEERANLECRAINDQLQAEADEHNKWSVEQGYTPCADTWWDICKVTAWEVNTRKEHTERDHDESTS